MSIGILVCSSSSWLLSHQLSTTSTISISQARSMFTSSTSSWRYRSQVILGGLNMSRIFGRSLITSKYFTRCNSVTCWIVVAELGTFWRSFVLFGNEKLDIPTDQEEESSQVKGSVSWGRIDCSSVRAKKCRKVFIIVTSYWKLFPFIWRLESIIFLLVSFPGTKGCSFEIHSYSGWPDIYRISTYELANLKNSQHSSLSFSAEQCLYISTRSNHLHVCSIQANLKAQFCLYKSGYKSCMYIIWTYSYWAYLNALFTIAALLNYLNYTNCTNYTNCDV